MIAIRSERVLQMLRCAERREPSSAEVGGFGGPVGSTGGQKRVLQHTGQYVITHIYYIQYMDGIYHQMCVLCFRAFCCTDIRSLMRKPYVFTLKNEL